MLAYLLFPVLLMISIHAQRLQLDIYKVRFTSSVIMTSCVMICICAYAWVADKNLDFEFLSDYRFYLSNGILTALIMLQMKCRKIFENNLPALNFSGFLVLAVLPLVSIAVTDLMSFKNTLEVKYENSSDSVVMCAIILVLTIIYYGGRLRSDKLNAKKLLLLALNLSLAVLSIVIHVKLIQENDALSFLLASNFFTCTFFLVVSRVRKEPLSLVKGDSLKPIIGMIACYMITQSVGSYIMLKLPVEEFNIIRCIGMVIFGYAYVYCHERKIVFSHKDLILLITIIGVYGYFSR
jgi:hypothetical protein